MTGFTEYFSEKNTHLAILAKMANADGKIVQSEMMLLKMIANKLSINQTDFDNITQNPEKYLNAMPASQEDRFIFFYTMIQMMKLDLEIDEKEMELYNEIGRRLGFSQEKLKVIMVLLQEKEKQVVQPDEIKELMSRVF